MRRVDVSRPVQVLLSLLVILPMWTGARVSADLIAYYPFEGDATDQSGNGFDGDDADCIGCAAGAGSGVDGVGAAFEFDGLSHVVIPIDINPTSLPQLTVTMWVRPDQAIVESPGLYKTFGHDDGGWDRTFGLDNRLPDGDFRYAAFNGGSGPGPTQSTGTEVTEDWTFLAAVWDTASGEIRFHANENSITEPLISTTGFSTAAIGNLRPDNFTEGWVGMIDEVRIFDEALTPEQVANVQNTGHPDTTITFTTVLNADQETHNVVNVPDTAEGIATATYNVLTGQLNWDVQWSGLSGAATAMHFHGPAEIGQPAGVRLDIGASSGLNSPSVGSANLAPEQADELLAGHWYVNIHTGTNGPGEIRGQMQRVKPADWAGGAGLWDETSNWSPQRAPDYSTSVAVASDNENVVLGPAADSLIRSIDLGSGGDGVAELRLRPGVDIQTVEGLTIGAQGRLVGAGSLAGPLRIEAQGELVVQTGDTFEVTGTVRPIAGVIDALGNLTLTKSATNLPGGVINATGSTLTFPGNGAKDAVGLTNQGTLNLTRVTVNGDIHSPSGSTINVGADVVFQGFISGAADFPGSGLVTFNGGFDPGDSPAAVSFAGDVRFGSDNLLRLELGGLIPGEQYDQVHIAGKAELDGTLVVELIDGFEPSLGDKFVLMTFGELGDSWFESIAIPPGPWSLDVIDHQLTLSIVPEPSGVALMLSALPLYGRLRRRQSRRAARAAHGLLDSPPATAVERASWCRRALLLLGLLTCTGLCAAPLHADLIAYYPFDTDATDQSGNNNHGVVDGAASPAGPASGFDGVGGSFRFDGAGHVIVPIDINPDLIPEMTVTMWVRPDPSIVNSPSLYKTFGHDDGGWDRTFGLDNRNGPYRYAAFNGNGITQDTGTPVTGDWTFLAAVWSSDELTVTLYANENSITEDLIETFSAHAEAAIGNLRPDNFSEGWRGWIDEVQIFDEVLTANEIAAIRNIGQTDDQMFINPAGGLWDDAVNWTGVGLPGTDTNAIIQMANGAPIIGPAANTTVRSLTIGATNGVAELRLTGDRTFGAPQGVNIKDNGRLVANGTLNAPLTIEAGGDLTVMSDESLQVGGASASIAGSVNVMGNLSFGSSVSAAATAQLNAIGGSLSFPGNGQKDGVGLTNAGRMNLTNATVNGDVNSTSGSEINVVSNATFNGLVSGAGNFPGAGTVTFNGGYQPGDSAALVEFAGDVQFGAANSLLIEIGGVTPGTQHDRLDIAGNVSLDGELRVQLIDGFVPSEGSQFVVMNYAGRGGTTFDNVVFPGANWSISYQSQQLVLLFGAGGLLGDFNNNGVLDAGDIDELTTQSAGGTNPGAFDLNGDALVNGTDVQIWVRDLFNSWIGDANLDGQFTSSDLVSMLASGTYEANLPSVWTTGDFTGDGRTTSSDLVAALADGGYEMGPRAAVAAVPEPAGFGLLLAGWLLLSRLTRRSLRPLR